MGSDSEVLLQTQEFCSGATKRSTHVRYCQPPSSFGHPYRIGQRRVAIRVVAADHEPVGADALHYVRQHRVIGAWREGKVFETFLEPM